MLHPLSPNDKKVEFTSPYGKWHVSCKNFALISDSFKLLFAPLNVIPLPRDISYQAVEIIRAYTRHPNSSTLNFEDPKSCLNQEKMPSILDIFNKNEEWQKYFDIVKVITDVYEFSSKWGIRRPLREAARYSYEHFSPEVIIKIIYTLSTERKNNENLLNDIDTKIFKSSFDPKYVGYDYCGIVDTSEFDLIVARHFEQYIHLLHRLPFYKINQILCKVKSLQFNDQKCKRHPKCDNISKLSFSIDDLLLNFIINDLKNVDYRTKEILISRFVNLNECSISKLQKFSLESNESENGQYIDLTSYSLKKLVEAEDELLAVKEELDETKEKYYVADRNSSKYLNGLHQLFEGKHGIPELTYLTAIKEKKVTPTNESQKVEELFNITVEEKIPESLFEKAKSLETVDVKQSLSIFQELTTNFTTESDQLVSEHCIELTNKHERNLATSILKMFVKTNRPKMLLTAYEVSLIDYRVVSTDTGEKCLKRAVRLGDKEASRVFCDYLLANDPTQCIKFCFDHSEQDPAFSFNIGSILLLGCKGPTVPVDTSESSREVEIQEVKIEPLASPITLPDSPYLRSPRGKTPSSGRGVSPFDDRTQSEGETFNLKTVMDDDRNDYQDKTIEAVPWKSIKYFERASSKGFNVSNLILSVISSSDRRRKEYYEKFMINSSSKKAFNSSSSSNGERIYPRTKFVVRVVLSLFDLIIETYPDLEKEMFGLVNSLVVHDRDASTAEFLVTRSSSANVFEALTRQSPKLSDYVQSSVDDLRLRASQQVPALLSNVHKVKNEEFREKSNVNEVLRFPEYLESIGDRGFYKCSSLKGVQFDYEVHKSRKNQSNASTQKQYFLKSIGKYAFAGCNELQAIFFNKVSDETNGDISMGIRSLSIGVSAFGRCNNLCFVELPENLVKIDERLFISCEKLISVDIPQRTQEIGESAFEGCKSLEFIALHNGIKVIRDGCFQFCDKLRIIIIPKSIKTVSKHAFRACISATSLLLQEGVEVIENEAFAGCKKLGFISFPKKSLSKISSGAFAQCPSLKSVTLPRNCVIEKGAFDEGVEISFYDVDDNFEISGNEQTKHRRSSEKKLRNNNGSFSRESDEFAFENNNQ